MADITQVIKPLRIELDSDESLRSQFNAYFKLNLRSDIEINSGASGDGSTLNQGATGGADVPLQSNIELCAGITLPTGNNLCIGAYNSVKTSEIYYELWNDAAKHSLWVYGTETQTCRKAYEGVCLNYQFSPQYHLPQHRCALFIVYETDTNGHKIVKSKYYVWTDGFNWQGFIDVETSIATDSFNPLTFPYWKTFYPFCDSCEYIQLAARPPYDCPKVLALDDDTLLQKYFTVPESNQLVDDVWYFRSRYRFRDGRLTTSSPISTETYIGSGNCPVGSEIEPKCFKLVINAGSALVEKIEILYSNDGVNWFLYDTINRYDDCPPQANFWQRSIGIPNYFVPVVNESIPCNPLGRYTAKQYNWNLGVLSYPLVFTIVIDGVTYTSPAALNNLFEVLQYFNFLNLGTFTLSGNQITVFDPTIVYGNIHGGATNFVPIIVNTVVEGTANTFIYQFCGNKQCIQVDPAETDRNYDDLPIVSVSQAIVDNRLVLGDNKYGYPNFICEPSNIKIGLEQDSQCNTGYVKIVIQAVIHNFINNRNQPITQLASSEVRAFGGYDTGGSIDAGTVSDYNQKIANEFHGLIGGFRATPYKSVSRQFVKGDPLHAYGVPQDPSAGIILNAYAGNYFYHEWEFHVPKQTYYIFEVYSHLAETLSAANGTSTYFYGTIDKSVYDPAGDIRSDMNLLERELRIPACSGDVNYADYIVIADLTQSNANAIGGYLREQDTNIPVELAMTFETGSTTIRTPETDANGFWFANSASGSFLITLAVLGGDCTVKSAVIDAPTDGARFKEDDRVVPLSIGYLADYNSCCHSLVTGTVIDCDGNPRSGIPVTLSRTGTVAVTDSEGKFTILAHDNTFVFNNSSGAQNRSDEADIIIFGTNGNCFLSYQCDSCAPCLPVFGSFFTSHCFNCPVTTDDVGTTTLGNLLKSPNGVKTGGRYGIAMWGKDYLGRNNSFEFIGFFDVPTIEANGVFAPYHFTFEFTDDLDLQDWVKTVAFGVTKNLNFTFKLSWVINKVEFIDAAGNITSSTVASKIRIYINGINDYNEQYLLHTNTAYQWEVGDRVRFITNGDGTVYTSVLNNGLIDLQVSGNTTDQFLVVNYDTRLSTLKAGATIELYNIGTCTTQDIYYEQCASIPVLLNRDSSTNEPIVLSGDIPFFDTYWLFRTIPTTDQNGLPVSFTSPYPYEHFAPSDFFGTSLTQTGIILKPFTIGRAGVVNPNASQVWRPDEIAWSDSLLEDGFINGLSTWRTANKKDYGIQNFGGIIAMYVQRRYLFALCENDWFTVNVDDNLLRATTDGTIYVNTAGFLSEAQQKIGNIYGCDPRDTGTIIFEDEWIFWIDAQNIATCFSNYQTVWDISKAYEGVSFGGTKSYFIEKLHYLASLRANNVFAGAFFYCHAGFDPKKNEVIISFFGRTAGEGGTVLYINNTDDYSTSLNESISFNVDGRYWSGNYSFVPERFIDFQSATNGDQLLSFRQGRVWMHHKILSSGITYNNFYGTQCDKRVKFVHNEQPDIQKRFLAVRIECREELFSCDQLYTQTGQQSIIPPEAFEFIENFYTGEVLCDINTINPNGLSALVDGDSLYGSWAIFRFVGDPLKRNSFCKIKSFIISSTPSY